MAMTKGKNIVIGENKQFYLKEQEKQTFLVLSNCLIISNIKVCVYIIYVCECIYTHVCIYTVFIYKQAFMLNVIN